MAGSRAGVVWQHWKFWELASSQQLQRAIQITNVAPQSVSWSTVSKPESRGSCINGSRTPGPSH